jgi:hypothetical protein
MTVNISAVGIALTGYITTAGIMQLKNQDFRRKIMTNFFSKPLLSSVHYDGYEI